MSSSLLRIATHIGFVSHSRPLDTSFTPSWLGACPIWGSCGCESSDIRGGPKMRIVAAMLATGAAVLALAATAGAATIGVQIRSTGFSPSNISLNHGDQVTWKNTDKVDHQVVADDGSFASPILHAGQSYTATFNRAGSFRYHDSFAA